MVIQGRVKGAQSLHIGLKGPITNLPFGIGKPSILTLRYIMFFLLETETVLQYVDIILLQPLFSISELYPQTDAFLSLPCHIFSAIDHSHA